MPDAECRINDEAAVTEALLGGISSFVIWAFLRASSFGFRHCCNHALAAITQIRMFFAFSDA
jgi:hypothetical protein